MIAAKKSMPEWNGAALLTTKSLMTAAVVSLSALAITACGSTMTPGVSPAGDRRGDISTARQLLMEGLENEMNAIELVVSGPRRTRVDLGDLKRRAYTINTMLLAFPHLFPQETRPVVAADGTRTPSGSIASAAVWADNETFYRLAQTGAQPAYDASQARNINQYRDSIKKLRNACDSCHARFMDEAALKAGYAPPRH